MLPPVRATLSSFVEYQNPQPQPLLRQTINAAAVANIAADASMPISGRRLDILSLSAQLQLAQGISIFAETIGKLIKLPRREGEALLDYAKRLMEAVKAMSPTQQASLERMLNQLVKGISLRLMTEILNNPTGPDAARLAVRLETAQLLERDLAAKAVVSSYRQNSGAEPAPLPIAQPPQRPSEAATAAAAPVVATEGPQSESAAASQAETDTAPHQAPSQTSAEGEQDAPTQAAAAHAEPAEPELQAQTAPTSGQTSPQPVQADPAATEGQIVQAAEQETIATAGETMGIELAETETAEVFAPILDDLPESRASRTSIDDADVWGPASNLRSDSRAPAAGFYDGPALARLSQHGLEDQPTLRQADAAKMGMPAMTEWLAEVFSEGNADLLEPLPAAAKVPPEQQVLEELFDKDALPSVRVPIDEQNKTILQTPRAYAAEEPEAPLTQGKPGSAPSNGSNQPANIADTAEQLVLPLPLPIIPREGVALPYVAYPPEDRERDPEERKAKAITPTDEDGEQQQGGGQQQFAEDRSHEEQAEEREDEAAGEQAEDGSRANDLYWRMAGWN
ncbi:hypothetical protein KX729_19555 [Rhizobium sp. XQZ8]|uniref:hypothetical protein n=1 Tax=Rhizobium populisoli TaxID=2859785 RepID=UPI001CA58E90|nr:hypothetical protein [Rhizobium populisoli]MBW6423659.1 hypothetical protein [Rhizobium populisoli]